MPPALVLLSHGSRDPAWADPVRAIRARLLDRQPARPVELAFLEFMDPRLEAAVTALVDSGAAAIRVAPLFLGQGGHLRRDVAALVEACRAAHPSVAIDVTPALGEAPAVRDAIAEWLLGLDHFPA